MSMTAVIVDDEQHCRDGLSKLLATRHADIELLAMASNVPDGIELVGRTRPTILFLDVEMAPHTGFELLQALGPEKPHVIFTTAHESYALNAIRFSALDFLLKPVDADDLAQAISKVQQVARKPHDPFRIMSLLNNVSRTNSGQLAIPSSNGMELVDPKNILYFQHTGDHIELHADEDTTLLLTCSMKECEDLLANDGFIRIQRTCLINPLRVREFSFGAVVMDDATRFTVEKRKEEDLKRTLVGS